VLFLHNFSRVKMFLIDKSSPLTAVTTPEPHDGRRTSLAKAKLDELKRLVYCTTRLLSDRVRVNPWSFYDW